MGEPKAINRLWRGCWFFSSPRESGREERDSLACRDNYDGARPGRKQFGKFVLSLQAAGDTGELDLLNILARYLPDLCLFYQGPPEGGSHELDDTATADTTQ